MVRTHWTVLFLMFWMLSNCSRAKTNHSEQNHSHHEHGMHHRFDDITRWVQEFESPEREQWQQPNQVIDWLHLSPNAIVADIGSGTGYFSIRIARSIPQGKVWAIDVEPAMVRYVNNRAQRESLHNVFSILALANDPMIPEKVDVILVVNTWHHIENRTEYARQLRSSLTPTGRLVIVDFLQTSPIGPAVAHRLQASVVEQELTTAGFRKTEEHLLPNQYVLTFTQAL